VAHTIKDKQKLLHRVRRLRGQVEAIERSLNAEEDCSKVLMTMAACRGSLAGLMAELVEGHIRHHLVDSESPPERNQAAQDIIDIVRSYLK
jgi:DNA-binding FrmR family transcriptional regulator